MADWQKIVSQHSGSVWQTAYRLLGRADEAADCFQETFLAALKVSGRQKVRNWPALLSRVCTCRAMDRLRKRLREGERSKSLGDWSNVASPNPGPIEVLQGEELSAGLRRALARLPEQQGEVFCMRCLNDMSYREIAKQLGLKGSAVGVLLHRARRRLRELLSEKIGPEDAET